MSTSAANTIVAFHIGRGGRFHNQGYSTFLGEKKISDFTNDLFLNFENIYRVTQEIKGRVNLQQLLEKAIECIADSENEAKEVFERRTGLVLGDVCYTDGGGNLVGLTVIEAETGIGTIDIDGDYDTTYTRVLSDCTEHELKLIAECNFISDAIKQYAENYLADDNI